MYLNKKRGIVVLIVFILLVLSLGILSLGDDGLTGAAIGVAPAADNGLNTQNLGIQADCGGVTACSCGDNVTSSYNLTTNLTSCSNDGLIISASNIVLDCKGYYITGSNAGNGINNTGGHINITIKNCNIESFGSNGIYFQDGGNSSLIFNNTINSSSHGIYFKNASNGTIINDNNITVSGNNNHGIYTRDLSFQNIISNNSITTFGTGGFGVHFISSSYENVLINNTIVTSEDTAYGIYISDTSCNTTGIINNTITTSGANSYGVHLLNSDLNNINNNNIICSGNDGNGVYFASSSKRNVLNNNIINSTSSAIVSEAMAVSNTISNNTLSVSKNGDYGFYSTSNHYQIDNNQITSSGNNSYGLYFEISDNNTVDNNSIITSGDSSHGIYLTQSSDNETVTNNSITTSGSNSYGIYVSNLFSYDNSFDNNSVTTSGNSSHGIYINDSTNNIINNNTITTSGNYSYGLYINNLSNQNISNNRVTTSSKFSYGIYVTGSNINIVDNNITTEGYDSDGIWFLSKNNNHYNISNNHITTGGILADGIYLSMINFSSINNNLIKNTNNSNSSGIYLTTNCKNNSVFSNTFNLKGAVYGIYDESDYGNFSYNIINIDSNNSNSTIGIYLISKIKGNYFNNTINLSGKHLTGIKFKDTNNNVFLSNNITTSGGNNHTPFSFDYISGNTIQASDLNQSINLTNNFNGNSIKYLYHEKNGVYSNVEYGSLYMFYCQNATIYNVTVNNAQQGIYSLHTNYSNITNCHFSNNTMGIRLDDSYNNYFRNNNFSHNGKAYSHSVDNIFFIRGSVSNNFYESDLLLNNSYGIYISANATNNEFNNTRFYNNTVDFYFSSGYTYTNATLFNSSTINRSKITMGGSAKAYFVWNINVNVTDISSLPLEGVTLTSYDSLGKKSFSRITNNDGIVNLPAYEYYKKGEVNYVITPTIVKAIKENYTSNTTSVNLYNLTGASINLTLTNIDCGIIISSEAYLGRNLSCNGNGINITNNTVLYGNGYSIIGSGSGNGIIIINDNNIISNLTITNFSRGIDLINSNNNSITNVDLLNNSYGVYFSSSNNTYVYDSLIENNSINDAYSTNDENTNNYFINSTINLNNITVNSTANLYKGWYVKVNATFNDGNLLSSGNVSGRSLVNELVEQSILSDENGVATLALSELKKNVSGTYYLTPHNITLSFDFSGNVSINSTTVNLTTINNTNVSLNINIGCVTPTSGYIVSGAVNFCPGAYNIDGKIYFDDGAHLTCYDTVLYDQSYLEINASNVIVEGCILNSTLNSVAIEISSGKSNVTIANNNITNANFGGIAITSSSNDVRIINNTIQSQTTCITMGGIISGGSSENLVKLNNLSCDGIQISMYGSINNVIKNNSFSGGDYGLYFYGNNSNTTTYYNIFSNILKNLWYTSTVTSFQNISLPIGNYAQGNQYDDYCDKGRDLNSDGYADTNSSGNNDWPYNNITSTKVYTDGENIVDYGPKIHDCVTDVFLGSSSGGGSSSSSSGGGNAPAATPASSQTVTQTEGDYSASEASKFLKVDTQTNNNNNNLEVKFTLENTGTKTMRLFPEIFQDVEDPFFIVTKKTLGYENSFFSRLAKLSYSEDAVSGRLLKAEIEEPEQIILEPGQKLEKTLTIKEGLVPSKLKVQFTTLGESVTEQEITSTKKVLSGTAVDVTASKQSFDIYAVIVPEELTESYQEYYAEQTQDLLTASAVADITSTDNEYMLEINIIKKENSFIQQSSFSDLYGPYKLKKAQNFIFAQQFKYNPEYYYGDYVLKTRIYKSDKTLVENEFDIDLGLKTMK
jgi:parallel beta-helix repeat protein